MVTYPLFRYPNLNLGFGELALLYYSERNS